MINKLDLMDIFRKLYPTTTEEYTPGTFINIFHVLRQKISFNIKD